MTQSLLYLLWELLPLFFWFCAHCFFSMIGPFSEAITEYKESKYGCKGDKWFHLSVFAIPIIHTMAAIASQIYVFYNYIQKDFFHFTFVIILSILAITPPILMVLSYRIPTFQKLSNVFSSESWYHRTIYYYTLIGIIISIVIILLLQIPSYIGNAFAIVVKFIFYVFLALLVITVIYRIIQAHGIFKVFKTAFKAVGITLFSFCVVALGVALVSVVIYFVGNFIPNGALILQLLFWVPILALIVFIFVSPFLWQKQKRKESPPLPGLFSTDALAENRSKAAKIKDVILYNIDLRKRYLQIYLESEKDRIQYRLEKDKENIDSEKKTDELNRAASTEYENARLIQARAKDVIFKIEDATHSIEYTSDLYSFLSHTRFVIGKYAESIDLANGKQTVTQDMFSTFFSASNEEQEEMSFDQLIDPIYGDRTLHLVMDLYHHIAELIDE